MPQDIASLSFNIDSQPAVQSHQALDQMAQRARLADQGIQSLSQTTTLAGASFASFTDRIGTAGTQLSQMAASLQTVITQLQSARAAIDLTTASFETFSRARDRVDALSSSLGTGVVALEAYARSASQLHMTSLETVGGVQRITAAIEAQTSAGRQLRDLMQDYGVVMNGITSSNADQVLSKFVEQVRSFRSSPGNTRIVQEVLGPLGVDSLTSVLNPDYEPVTQRANRLRVDDMQRNIAQMVNDSTLAIRSARGDIAALSDLRSNYDLSRLSRDQMGTLYAGMETRPLSLQDPRNELQVLRFLDQGAPDALRSAARTRDPGGGGIGGAWDYFAGGGYMANMQSAQAQMLQRRVDQDSWFGGGLSDFMSPYGPSPASRLWNSAIGIAGRGAFNSMFGQETNIVPLRGDTRSGSGVLDMRRRVAEAEGLAAAGYADPLRSLQAEQHFDALGRGESRDRLSDIQTRMIGMLGPEEARPIFENMRDRAAQARDDAMTPDAAISRQIDLDRWLASVPWERRGRARSLLEFGQRNGISTRQWPQQGLSPGTLMSGTMRGDIPGALSPAQREAFLSNQAGESQNFIAGQRDAMDRDSSEQGQLRGVLELGSGVVERNTAYLRAYNDELARSGIAANAAAAGSRALQAVIERQTTASQQSLIALRKQNDEQERMANLMGAAGSDPVARRSAQLAAGIAADVTARAEQGLGDLPAYQAQRTRALGIQAGAGSGDIVAENERLLAQQRQLATVAGSRADIQQRLIADLQVEAQFRDALAQAEASGNEQVAKQVRERMQAVKDLRAEYDLLARTTDNMNSARDMDFQARFQDYLNSLPPGERRIAAGRRSVFQANPTLLDNPLDLPGPIVPGGSVPDPLGAVGALADQAAREGGTATLPGGIPNMLGSADHITRSAIRAQDIEANEEFGYQQSRANAALRATIAGGGDFGRRLAGAMVIDPRSPNGGADAERRVGSELSSQRLSLAQQEADLTSTEKGVRGLADAWRNGREAGEEFERHLTNQNMINQLGALKEMFPGLAKEIDGAVAQLERLNPQLDRLAATQRAADFRKDVSGRMADQNELLSIDVEAGPFASAERLGRMRAELLARQIESRTAGGDRPISYDDALDPLLKNETLKQQAQDVAAVRQEFQRFESSAASAFETAVIGGKELSAVVVGLGQDLERFALRAFVEKPFMKGLEWAADGLLSGAAKLFSGASKSGAVSSGVSGQTALLSDAASWASALSLFGADGLVISGGQPHRYLAGGGELLTRPTHFMAAGGTRVTAGEVDHEVIMPLKRDATGNLGIRASGGGGAPNITISASFTFGANSMGRDGKVDQAAAAAAQRQMEALMIKGVRNVMANEMRDGGDLTVR